jgi:hypothetical protein
VSLVAKLWKFLIVNSFLVSNSRQSLPAELSIAPLRVIVPLRDLLIIKVPAAISIRLSQGYLSIVEAIAIDTCIRKNQNPNNVGRSKVPPHIIWVLCPIKTDYGYI